MAYQLDLEKGFLEINLENLTSYDFIEESNRISTELKKKNNTDYKKFEIVIHAENLGKSHNEAILFGLLYNVLIDVKRLVKKEFSITVLWYYKNNDELEMGNEMNEVLDEHFIFQFPQTN